MAKINTLTVEGTKKDGFKVTAMLDDGAIVEIKEGFEFISKEDHTKDVEEAAETYDENLVAARKERDDCIDALQAEIGQLQQELAKRPEVVRAPLMHVEHQDIPTSRKIDNLASLDALAPAPALPDPYQYRLEIDPDAPARPPAVGELHAHRGEYVGTANFTDTEKTEA